MIKFSMMQRLLCLFAIAAIFYLTGCDSQGANIQSSPQVARSMVQPAAGNLCTQLESLEADQHPVTAWMAAPSDALLTHPITGLTVRQSFAPHWSGNVMRLRLSNRYSGLPVTFENIHIAKEEKPGSSAMVPGSQCKLLFAGQPKVRLAPGESAYSDWMTYPIQPFERVGISFFAPEFTPQVTRHLNSNEALYISLPGDHSANVDGTPFVRMPEGYISNFLVIDALEVAAPKTVSTVVTVGDSITDGSDSTTGFKDGSASPMIASDQRYPNHLQALFLKTGMQYAVANAGIGGNELLRDGWLPQFGPALLSRLDMDVLKVAGATHVLLMIGTNDLGNPRLDTPPTSEQLIAGYKKVIERVHAAGLKIILGTIPPAEGTLTDGLTAGLALPAPFQLSLPVMHGTAQARRGRDEVNIWIKQQALSDGIVDFDACLADEKRLGYLAPQYNSGDNLHPTPAGYKAMAGCVDLNLFRKLD
ncbi:MAG: GDSL-type esterase/lipase family protein [Limnobacter sp.]|nr:GDSL-type esterase/lipase family protein [Limnobacter sp.]